MTVYKTIKSCPCCSISKPEIDFMQTSEDFDSVSICTDCVGKLQSIIEDDRKSHDFDYEQKRRKRERKLFKKFMKRYHRTSNEDALGCLIFVLIGIAIFVLYLIFNNV